MAIDILQTLIVRLKAEGAKKTQADVDKVQKSTKRSGVVMNKVSKRFGLAFKAAGLFAAGLFASILKGGPITALFLAQTWRAIGHLGDTILGNLGAWDALSDITDTIYSLNDAIATGDINALATMFKNFGLEVLKVSNKILLLPVALQLIFGKKLIDKIRPELAKLKTFIKEKLVGIMTAIDTILTKIFKLFGLSWDAIKDDAVKKWTDIKTTILGVVTKLITSLRSKLAIIESIKRKIGLGEAEERPIKFRGEPSIIRRQAGGPARAGEPMMVGERGPELFIPPTSGAIAPSHALGRGGIIENHIRIDLDGRRVYEGIKRHMASDIRRLGG